MSDVMHRREVSDIESAIRQENRVKNPTVEGRDNPSSMEAVERSVMERCRAEVERVEDQLPFDAADVTIVTADGLGGAMACVSPIRCGEYKVVDTLSGVRWEVEKQPDGYAIFVRVLTLADHDGYERTVRHELAHAADWHENQYTTEQRDTHAEWMDRLDAWD